MQQVYGFSESATSNPAGAPRLVSDEPDRDEKHQRVSLHPVDPSNALRAMLQTPPAGTRRN